MVALRKAVLLLALLAALEAASEPSSRYSYEDIARFNDAYSSYQQTGEAAEFAAYLDGGTRGLDDFKEQFELTPESLAARVDKYPGFFASLGDLAPGLRAQEPVMDAMFAELEALFPGYDMPTVYFLIGGLRAGGQAGDGNYVMVAAETYARKPGTDLSELHPGSRQYAPDYVVHMVAHEAAHIIQEEIQGNEQYLSIYTQPEQGTLLAYALREGVANFVAALVSGGHINPEAEPYGLEHEKELWALFREEALGTELGDWFFYQPKDHPDWPKDLGYWLGYRLALRCYDDATDKPAMLHRLMRAEEPVALLEECAP